MMSAKNLKHAFYFYELLTRCHYEYCWLHSYQKICTPSSAIRSHLLLVVYVEELQYLIVSGTNQLQNKPAIFFFFACFQLFSCLRYPTFFHTRCHLINKPSITEVVSVIGVLSCKQIILVDSAIVYSSAFPIHNSVI